MLPPADIEIKLISSILEPRDLTRVVGEGVTVDMFIVHKAPFEYMVAYAQTYGGSIPARDDLEKAFKDTEDALELVEAGQLKFYIDELLKLDLARGARDVLKSRLGEAGKNLEDDPVEAVRLITQDLQKIQRIRGQNMSFLDRDAMARYEWAEEKLEAAMAGEILGLPTGLKVFDAYQQGWQPGEAIMLMGPKGCGKSWMMLYMSCIAYYHGAKVLYLSPEMSWEECGLRFDVLLASLYEQKFSHTSLTSGLNVDLTKYKAWLTQISSREDFICVDNPGFPGFTLANMSQLIEEFQPDLCVLDGIHLVRDANGVQDWSVIKDVADGLKEIAQRRKMVVIWASQVDKEGMRNSGEPVSSGAQAAYGKAAVEAANRLITMGIDTDNPHRRTFKVPNNRNGREWLARQYLLFEVDVGRIEQIDQLDVEKFSSTPEF